MDIGGRGFFLSFLSGYFDAEGCVGFDLRPGQRSVSWMIASMDLGILRQVTRRLRDMGFGPTLRLALEAGEGGCNSDFWRVRISNRAHVQGLLRRLRLRHPEKVAKAGLVHSLASSNWNEGWGEVMKLRIALRNEILESRRDAMLLLSERRSLHASTGHATSPLLQSTTALSAERA
ncbi:MAG: LAGLIDADG family homing endonuclease [Nitrososphaerota archaeon]|nr:LAGLIDADG family homing endonuclease [Nitrososphaerota archaeon]